MAAMADNLVEPTTGFEGYNPKLPIFLSSLLYILVKSIIHRYLFLFNMYLFCVSFLMQSALNKCM